MNTNARSTEYFCGHEASGPSADNSDGYGGVRHTALMHNGLNQAVVLDGDRRMVREFFIFVDVLCFCCGCNSGCG